MVSVFKFEHEGNFSEITTVSIKGEPWFSAPDVCNQLELGNVTKALYGLDDDEKLTLPVVRAGQSRAINFVNESGLYALIFKSRKPTAKQFRKWVTGEVIPSIRKTGSYAANGNKLPIFIQRYAKNWGNIEPGYFSIITEVFPRIYMRFEREGYVIPEKDLNGHEIRLDVSVGITFSQYLKKHYPAECNKHKYYPHAFLNGPTVEARQYPETLMSIFLNFLNNVWIPEIAPDYFKKKDTAALTYLPKLLAAKRA